MDSNFSFFVLPAAAGTPPAKLQVDAAGNPLRKRQPHHKSRNGCATCKRRKVKCDETSPACLNCTRRNLQCGFKVSFGLAETHSRRRIEAAKTSGPSQSTSLSQLEFLDRLTRQYREISLTDIFHIQMPGFSAEVEDDGNSVHQGPNAGQPQRSRLNWLEMLDKHSTDHRAGVACPTCFTRAGMQVENVHDTEEVTPSCNLMELAPSMSSKERELLLYFEKFTSQNLALCETLWRTIVLRSAWQYDFVKSAILLVTIAHMKHNTPTYNHDRESDLQYISSALSGLRGALSSDMTCENLESIISCTSLLVHYAWSHMEHDLNADIDIAVCFSHTADHFHGLKDCMALARGTFGRTKWSSVLVYSPRVNLERYLMKSQSTANKLEDVFLHCIDCGLSTRASDNASNNNISAIKRLIIVLNVICISSPDIESTGLLPDIYRYLFTWPSSGRLSTKGFILQIGEGNPVSLTILLYYYAAILRVYTEKIWWMRDGATMMFNKLRSKLGGHCSQCTDIPLSLLAPPEQQATAAYNLDNWEH